MANRLRLNRHCSRGWSAPDGAADARERPQDPVLGRTVSDRLHQDLALAAVRDATRLVPPCARLGNSVRIHDRLYTAVVCEFWA